MRTAQKGRGEHAGLKCQIFNIKKAVTLEKCQLCQWRPEPCPGSEQHSKVLYKEEVEGGYREVNARSTRKAMNLLGRIA